MLFDQLKKIIETTQDGSSACFQLNEEMVETIYNIGVQHGLFPSENYGLHDRQNSVYCFIGTLFDTKKIMIGEELENTQPKQKYTIEERVIVNGWAGSGKGTVKDIKWVFHNRLGEHTWGYFVEMDDGKEMFSMKYIPEGYLRKLKEN